MTGKLGSLRVGVLWATAGSSVYIACQYGILISIAKLGTQEDVGRFALAQAIIAPIIVLSQMQFRQLQVTDVRGAPVFADYLAARVVGTLLAMGAVATTILVAGYRGSMATVILLIGLAKAFESVSDVAHGELQRHERMDLVARSQVVKGIASLTACAAVMWSTRNVALAVAALAASWGLLLLMYDLPLVLRVLALDSRVLAWRRDVVVALARTAVPLAVASGLISLSGNMPRYFLEAYGGSEAVALFATAATPLALLSLIHTAFGQATLPRAAIYLQSGNRQAFLRLTRANVALQVVSGLAIAALLAVAGRFLMRVLFTQEYDAAGPVAALLAVAVGLGGLGAFGSTVLTAGRRFTLQLWHIVVVVLVQLPLSHFLIRSHGVLGAAVSEVGRYLVATCFLTIAGVIVFSREGAGAGGAGPDSGTAAARLSMGRPAN